jgi:hypothetical protein
MTEHDSKTTDFVLPLIETVACVAADPSLGPLMAENSAPC